MTKKEACRILGVAADASLQDIKKRYRHLMTQVHPDVHVSVRKRYAYSAREINIAYSVLRREREEAQSTSSRRSDEFSSDDSSEPADGSRKNRAAVWDAPVNLQAYMERDIFHYAEDFDGSIIGHFPIARGKYLWKTEEDFPLFLRSIYLCGKQLLDEIDDRLHRRAPAASRLDIQAELTYLLAQQFIHSTALLHELAKEKITAEDGSTIFRVAAMLETGGDYGAQKSGAPLDLHFVTKAPVRHSFSLKPGDLLYPAGIRKHRLYLKNRGGHELGYLSFHDDRMYYIVVPLLEQRGVMVRVESAGTAGTNGSSPNRETGSRRSHPLRLWLKLPQEAGHVMPENLNLKIENLLNEYQGQV